MDGEPWLSRNIAEEMGLSEPRDLGVLIYHHLCRYHCPQHVLRDFPDSIVQGIVLCHSHTIKIFGDSQMETAVSEQEVVNCKWRGIFFYNDGTARVQN